MIWLHWGLCPFFEPFPNILVPKPRRSLPRGFPSLVDLPSTQFLSPPSPPSPLLSLSILFFVSVVQAESSLAPPAYFDQMATGWFCCPCLSHIWEARFWPRSILVGWVDSPLFSFLPFHLHRSLQLKPFANQSITSTTSPFPGEHGGKNPVSLLEVLREWDSIHFRIPGTSSDGQSRDSWMLLRKHLSG
jgi:hypothetical protein